MCCIVTFQSNKKKLLQNKQKDMLDWKQKYYHQERELTCLQNFTSSLDWIYMWI